MQNIPLFTSDEAKLKDSLNRYRQMIDDTPMCIKVFDGKGKLIFLNKGGRDEHFIKDTDDIANWDWAATVEEEDQTEVVDAFQRGLRGEASQILMHHTPEGAKHEWCEGIISPIRGDNGEVSLLLFYSIDATARVKANEDLKKMNDLMVGRELKMVELKKQIEELKSKGGDI